MGKSPKISHSFQCLKKLKGTMSKGKPRHNPDKPANKRSKHCPEYETMGDNCWCVAHPEIDGKKLKCGGNRHNCVKVDYQKQAILKEL
jgi:hypothetical protein